MTFPSGKIQAQLMREVYDEAGVDPRDVTYFESHSAGTQAGDPQELNGICDVICANRKQPLLIGKL